MTRSFFFALTLLCGVLMGPSMAEESRSQQIAGFFKQTSWLGKTDVDRCSALLKQLVPLNSEPALKKQMIKAGCFNRFDGTSLDIENAGLKVDVINGKLIVRIGAFTSDVADELNKAIGRFDPSQIQQVPDVVIDLAGNSGGSIIGARNALALFAPSKESRFVNVIGKCPDLDKFQTSHGTGILANKRYTIFADEDTASASEMMVAQLRYEWYPQQTTLIGVGSVRTFGKSIMQYNDPDLDVRVTCGQWVVPKHPIQHVGMLVDHVIPKPNGVCDEQYLLDSIKGSGLEVVGAK